ncbi:MULTISPECIES: winged helix-turn-helix domain-containing protein [Candidatus Rhabdochlamydia]
MKYTESDMTDWLKRKGFVYKNPIKVPGKLELIMR